MHKVQQRAKSRRQTVEQLEMGGIRTLSEIKFKAGQLLPLLQQWQAEVHLTTALHVGHRIKRQDRVTVQTILQPLLQRRRKGLRGRAHL
ncbi:hypothetical protein D3C85_1291040 [compost metagenome]